MEQILCIGDEKVCVRCLRELNAAEMTGGVFPPAEL